MNNLFKILSKRNHFNFAKLSPHSLDTYLTKETDLIDYIKKNVTFSEPFVLLKHHLTGYQKWLKIFPFYTIIFFYLFVFPYRFHQT